MSEKEPVERSNVFGLHLETRIEAAVPGARLEIVPNPSPSAQHSLVADAEHAPANANGVQSFSPGLPQATLGARRVAIQPRRGCGQTSRPRGATPLGLRKNLEHIPKVGARRQPWALRQNAVGVLWRHWR